MLAARARRGLQQAVRNLLRFLFSGEERHNYLAPTQGGSRYPAGRNIQFALAGGAGGAVTNYRLSKRSNLAGANHEQVPQSS